MRRGRTFRWGRTRPADGQSNNPETLSRIQSLADYTIDTLESSFQTRQGFYSQRSGTRLTVCAFLRWRGNGEEVWLALAAIRLFEAKGFSGLALAVLVRALAVIGLSRGRPCSSKGGAPCRQLPPRLRQPTASTIGSVGM